jgi:hypothetical protein
MTKIELTRSLLSSTEITVAILVGIFSTSTSYFYPCSKSLAFCTDLEGSIYSDI